MTKKTQSLLIVFGLYVIGALLAAITFFMLPYSNVISLLIADVVYTLFIYVCSLVLKNASLYDPYWSVIPPVLLIFVAINARQPISMGVIFMLFGLTFWSIRLTYNWIKHWTDFTYLDWRYKNFQDANPKLYWLSNLFAIQLTPTFIVFAQIALGVYVIEANPQLNPLTVIGTVMMIVAAVIQFIADAQMDQFKEANKGKKACIDEGLWRYSRHPNYLGEVTVWWGLYLIYYSINGFDPWIISPLIMTALFLFISIPLMEKKILKTRPEYKIYQEQVSMFMFWPRKQAKEQIEETN